MARDFKSALLQLHKDDLPAVTRILRVIRGEIGAYPIYEVPPASRCHHGAVCLVGDAAHAIGPHVGQGASLALEDAFVLAKCLRDASTPEVAVERFEQLRLDRVQRVVDLSQRLRQYKAPAGWLGRKLRNLVLPIFLRKSANATNWLYEAEFDWDKPFTQ